MANINFNMFYFEIEDSNENLGELFSMEII